ncbi:MAG: glycosyl hydrolase [Candidatus Omnitrophota bacterium]
MKPIFSIRKKVLNDTAFVSLLVLTLSFFDAMELYPAAQGLEGEFTHPPDSAKPWVYWWWLNGNVTREGITKDLEEMKRQGINGVLIFNAGGADSPSGPPFMSPAWRELFRFALREADRLRMEVSVNLCDGWDAGGPWITAEYANKKLVYSEIQVDGANHLSHELPLPPLVDGYYREIAVIAFPEKASRPLTPARVTASSSLAGYCEEWNYPPEDAADNDPETFWSSANAELSAKTPVWLTLAYHEPLNANGMFISAGKENGPRECELQGSIDGAEFSPICRFTLEKGESKRIDFASVLAQQFRLTIDSAYGAPVQIAEMQILRPGGEPYLRPGIKWFHFKSGNRSFWDYPRQGPIVMNDEYPDDGAWDCRSEDIWDLTSRMDAQGRIEWDVPHGRWTILRFGYTLEGQRTRCGTTVIGYESDMLSSKGIERHFQHTAEPILEEAAAAGAKSLKYFHIDSYELGADIRGQQPTWSEAFRQEFKIRRGYDLLPYLPAMARRIVDNRERTNRLFWDFRHTIGDLMAEKFFRRFNELAHERGIGAHSETGYGTYPYPHIDGLQCAGTNDITMGEFWQGTDIMSQFNHFGNVIRSVASAAHIYGRRLIQAEAFTSWNHWVEYPFALKPTGDEAFCNGLNRMVFHQYTHQPLLQGKPGWQYGAGTHFDCNITWWEQSQAFFQYLARCQHLLQQGKFVADVCYFYGEGATSFVPSKEFLRPSLPYGYDFDAVNAEVLLTRISVKNGRLTLPDGMSYRLLVLPEDAKMSPKIVKKIEELLQAGAAVSGPKPKQTPGLTDYPNADMELKQLADSLWGEEDKASGHKTIGAGKLFWGEPLADVLAQLNLPPDVEFQKGEKEARMEFIHRSIEDQDFYFLSNQTEKPFSAQFLFRVSGKQPELWDPVTGERRDLPQYEYIEGRASAPLEFAPYQSYFIVFRKPASSEKSPGRNFPALKAVQELGGPWTLHFDPQWGGPEEIVFDKLQDWTKRPEEGIKYYSGTATYRKTFNLPDALRQPGQRLYLDLGKVDNVAVVRSNGNNLGVIWCAPWRVEITNAVQATNNKLEIDVVNLWPNRLIGDAKQPKEKRFTLTNIVFNADSPLLESGLLGPIILLTAENDH